LPLTFYRVRSYSSVVRYSAEHKAQNHEKILAMAARSFREDGGDSSGIGTVMKKVGLAKGGFYRHFRSKDDLFVEAVARAFDEPLSVRKRIEASQEAYRERLLPYVPGQTREEKLAKFQLLFPSMAGVLTAARVKSSPQERERMLREAREFFIKSFTER
jgi:TetR/AcrR family transcriptional regulator, transcriptional repressor for nem operon